MLWGVGICLKGQIQNPGLGGALGQSAKLGTLLTTKIRKDARTFETPIDYNPVGVSVFSVDAIYFKVSGEEDGCKIVHWSRVGI